MAITGFASIYIGSYELSMKIFEINSKKKLREIDHVRSRIDLGKEVYQSKAVGYETVEQICDLLLEFMSIIKSYRVNNYEIYATVALHDATNELFVLNQIQIRTGLKVQILSNSEHRFITYESIAGSSQFASSLKRDAAVVDVGGSGMQITLFEQGEIITTQHMDLGMIRLRNMLRNSGNSLNRYYKELEEFIMKKLEVFRQMYLNKRLETVILISDYGQSILAQLGKDQNQENTVKADKFIKYTEKHMKKSDFDREDPFEIPSFILFKCLTEVLDCDYISLPGTDICDGIAYDFARKKSLISVEHDFDQDVLSASRNLAEHFHSFSPHIESLYVTTSQIFDAMKKVHGLNKRHLLLLRCATLLHDVGKYVSISNSPESAYHIIMESEIIGLTHLERHIVAYTVLFNTLPLMRIEDLPDSIDEESYLVFAKLSAILRVANALDQSHKQKFGNVKISLKNRELVITVEATEDIGLEKALFAAKTNYFENVFSIKPILKEKKVYNLKL